MLIAARMRGQAPDIDGLVIINDIDEGAAPPEAGQIRRVEITEAHPYDVVGTLL